MDQIKTLLQNVFFGNTVLNYLIAAGVFLLVLVFLKLLQWSLFRRLQAWADKTPGKADNLILKFLHEAVIPLFYVSAFYFGLKQLVLSAELARFAKAVLIIVLTFQTIRLIIAVSIYLLERTWLKAGRQGSASASKSILTILRMGVWSVGVIFLLDNLGFNVSAVVAGLGIGGIAVALAAQTILGDLFNYFVIFFDQPFEEGDFIIFDDYMGEIENIGIKSTRIRSLGGEQIVISNTNLTAAKIRNYKRMSQRRVLFSLGVTYETPHEKLRKIPAMLREIIESVKKTSFDRAHFKTFGAYSLDFEIVYFVLSSDYNHYMDIQQQINFLIREAFQKEGIDFAYPTAVEYQKELK